MPLPHRLPRPGRATALAALLLLAAGLGGCMTALPPSRFAGGAPTFRPEAFFEGATGSSGVLESGGGAPTRRLHVQGVGRVETDGSFRLDQTVTFDDKPANTRTWVMRRTGEHRYTATLTDASGPVEGEAYGDLFHLTYPMKSPFGGRMEQWMYLQPDGRTVVNEATVRMFGLPVAHLSERITRAGGAVGGP